MASDDPAGSAARSRRRCAPTSTRSTASWPRSTCSSGQARAEAARHEQKRAQAAEKLAGAGPKRPGGPGGWLRHARDPDPARRAHGGAGRRPGGQAQGARPPPRRPWPHVADARSRASRSPTRRRGGPTRGATPALPPSLSRVVLSAQEDLRREIARAMHDGPAQSLTNIVLQAQIVDRLAGAGPGHGQGRAPACSCRWSSRRWTPPRPSSSTSGRWCSTTWASCPRSGAPRVTGAAVRTSPSSSSRWARTGACRWTSRAPSSGSWTRPWPRTSRSARSGCSSGWTGATSWRPACPRTGPPVASGDGSAARGAHGRRAGRASSR